MTENDFLALSRAGFNRIPLTLETLAELAVHRPDVFDPVVLVRAMTGRGTLPEGANLLG